MSLADAEILQPPVPVPSFGLAGRIALVTGGSQGIGWGIASGLAGAGAAIVIANRNEALGQSAAERLAASGVAAEFIRADVGVSGDIHALFDTIEDRHGRLDILVNNSGVVVRGLADGLDEADWDQQLAVNLKGPWLCARRAAGLMPHGGRIINIASLNAIRPGQNKFVYGVSKAGLVQLTRTLATEWAPRQITANAIAPGMIATARLEGVLDEQARAAALARVPLGRSGTIADVAGAALFLASDAAAYVTGQLLIVDGGSCLT